MWEEFHLLLCRSSPIYERDSVYGLLFNFGFDWKYSKVTKTFYPAFITYTLPQIDRIDFEHSYFTQAQCEMDLSAYLLWWIVV